MDFSNGNAGGVSMPAKPSSQPESDFPKLSQPAHRALAGAGYTRLEQLTKVSGR